MFGLSYGNIFIMCGDRDEELTDSLYLTDDETCGECEGNTNCDESQQPTLDAMITHLLSDDNTTGTVATTTDETPLLIPTQNTINTSMRNPQHNDSSIDIGVNVRLLINAIRDRSSPTLNDHLSDITLASVINESFPQLFLDADDDLLGHQFLDFIDEHESQLNITPPAMPSIKRRSNDPSWTRTKNRKKFKQKENGFKYKKSTEQIEKEQCNKKRKALEKAEAQRLREVNRLKKKEHAKNKKAKKANDVRRTFVFFLKMEKANEITSNCINFFRVSTFHTYS